MILGLDVSTSKIGYCILDYDGKIIYYTQEESPDWYQERIQN